MFRKKVQIAPQIIQDSEFEYLDMGKHPPSDHQYDALRYTLGDSTWSISSINTCSPVYSVFEIALPRCAYCNSLSERDERGNCSACGAPK